MYKKFGKRLFDFSSSALGVIVMLPVFLILTPIIAISVKGNPFFSQKRAGKNGKSFRLIKFRTMLNTRDINGELLADEQRVTKFGRIIRSLSIDELPQLFNILLGHMSIVGPRPLLVEYLPLYNEFQSRRHEVRPGLTGLAQISGRNDTTWQKRFEKDIEYLEKYSFAFDLKIIFATIKKIFKREGVENGENITIEIFKGNNSDDESEVNMSSEDNILIESEGEDGEGK